MFKSLRKKPNYKKIKGEKNIKDIERESLFKNENRKSMSYSNINIIRLRFKNVKNIEEFIKYCKISYEVYFLECNILKHPIINKEFIKYSKQEHSEENIMLWNEMNRYNKLGKMEEESKKEILSNILNNYIIEKSKYELNINNKLRAIIVKSIKMELNKYMVKESKKIENERNGFIKVFKNIRDKIWYGIKNSNISCDCEDIEDSKKYVRIEETFKNLSNELENIMKDTIYRFKLSETYKSIGKEIMELSNLYVLMTSKYDDIKDGIEMKKDMIIFKISDGNEIHIYIQG